MYYVLDLKWALIVGLTVANIMDHKAQLQNMAIEEVFRHQMGGVGIIPLRMCCFDVVVVVPVVWWPAGERTMTSRTVVFGPL